MAKLTITVQAADDVTDAELARIAASVDKTLGLQDGAGDWYIERDNGAVWEWTEGGHGKWSDDWT